MLVHGEKEGMLKLSRVLQRELGVPIHTPPTGQTTVVPLESVERRLNAYIHEECFRRPWTAVGSLNTTPPSLKAVSWECDDPAVG